MTAFIETSIYLYIYAVGIQEPESAQVATKTTSIIKWRNVIQDTQRVLKLPKEQ